MVLVLARASCSIYVLPASKHTPTRWLWLMVMTCFLLYHVRELVERGSNDYPGERMSLLLLCVSLLLKGGDEVLREIGCVLCFVFRVGLHYSDMIMSTAGQNHSLGITII